MQFLMDLSPSPPITKKECKMATCMAKRRDGSPCQAAAGIDGYCFRHRPGEEAESARKEASSMGGKSGRTYPTLDEAEVSDIVFDHARAVTRFCASIAKWVLSGRVDSKSANAAILAASTALRALDSGEVDDQIAGLRAEIERLKGLRVAG
jgi:uncharacterized small protein (DUF1192 family)